MRKVILFFLIAALPVLSADEAGGVKTADTAIHLIKSLDSTAVTTEIDTIGTPAIVRDPAADSTAANPPPDRSVIAKTTIDQPETEASTKSSIKKIPLTKRKYNYRQQIILAIGMMAFVVIIMTSAQNWNPK